MMVIYCWVSPYHITWSTGDVGWDNPSWYTSFYLYFRGGTYYESIEVVVDQCLSVGQIIKYCHTCAPSWLSPIFLLVLNQWSNIPAILEFSKCEIFPSALTVAPLSLTSEPPIPTNSNYSDKLLSLFNFFPLRYFAAMPSHFSKKSCASFLLLFWIIYYPPFLSLSLLNNSFSVCPPIISGLNLPWFFSFFVGGAYRLRGFGG